MAPPKKAAGKASTESKNFKVGDIVLGRLKGFPYWPSRVAAYDDIPSGVQRSRPAKHANMHCVQFFPVGDFAWLHVREIEALPQHQIQAWLQEDHRKISGDLKKAYAVALDPTEWDAGLKTSQAEVDEAVDELEDEEEEEEAGGSSAKAGSKRKKPASKKGTAKKAKSEVKQKTDSKPPTKRSKPAPSSKKPESKAAPVENQAAPADDDPLASDPNCIKVKDWRHRLQRTFLGKTPPSDADMDAQDDLFKAIEAYKDITVDALQYSKIGKVMKKICSLDNIPRNDELKITDRARQLMEGWSEVITKHEAANGHANGTANGVAEGEGGAAPKSASAAPVSKKESTSKPASKAAPAPTSAGESSAKKEETDAAPAAEEKKDEADAPAPAPAAEATSTEEKKEGANGTAETPAVEA